MRTEAAVGQSSWTPDGTQAPSPPPMFADPLAGLVTGAKPDLAVTGDNYDELIVPVPRLEPDDEEARARLAAVFADDDDEPPAGRPVPLPPPAAFSGGLVPGMVAEPERKPSRLRVRKALGGYPKDAANRRKQLGDRRQELMAQRFGSRRSADTEAPAAGDRKPVSNTNVGGIILGLVLLAVFGFIALQVIVSIVESIGSAFD